MKKFVSIILSVSIALSSIISANVFASEDYMTRGEVCNMLLKAADYYNADVNENEILQGYENGEKNENEPVTRAEALIMLKRAFGDLPELKGNNLRVAIPKESFTDIPEWAEGELSDVFDAGIVAGKSEGVFAPDDNITKKQMETFISRVYAIYGTNIKDDFYVAINKEDLDNSEIEDGRDVTGTIYNLGDKADKQVNALIEEIAEGTPEYGSNEEKIKILYNNILNMEARNEMGYEPIRAYIEEIDNMESISDFEKFNKKIYDELGISFINFELGSDSMDSSSYITEFLYPAAPFEKEVYNGEFEHIKTAYINYIESMLILCGVSETEAKNSALNYFEFEKQLSNKSLTTTEYYDVEKTYNIYTLDEIDEIFEYVNIKEIFDISGYKNSDKILVTDKGCMEQLSSMLTDDNIESVKNYIKICFIDTYAGCFGEDFQNIIDTYNQEVSGISGNASLESIASASVTALMPDYIGKAYADRYCNDETKAEVAQIVEDVISVYNKRINNLDWMSDETKKKAVSKLDAMQIKIGAPEKWNNYLDSAELKSFEDGGSYFQNIVEITKLSNNYLLSLEGKPVDKTEWAMYPFTVNAAHVFQLNDVTIPTAFLQAPIYSSDMSYEEKLGKVGFIVGHEISHAFDNSGSQYDNNGNATDWWNQEDKAKFYELCDDVIEFYNGIEAAPGIDSDPVLTMGENIADLGAIQCITEIASQHKDFDYEKMYISYGKMWYASSTRERLINNSISDVHSNSRIRVNRVLQSCDKFYEVFDIKPGDGMYVEPENRVHIW